jgi:predicted transposase YbfD/YdcC
LQAGQLQSARTVDKGHGRVEIRELTSTTALIGYLEGWADVCQVFVIKRIRVVKGERTEEEAYGITSLSRAEADAGRLLALVRGHWAIENSLHWVRDVTMGEDGCRVRRGNAPRVLAAFRNMAVHLLTEMGPADEPPNRARAMRHLGANASQALQIIGLPSLE